MQARALFRVVKGNQQLVKITVHLLFLEAGYLTELIPLGIIRKGVKSDINFTPTVIALIASGSKHLQQPSDDVIVSMFYSTRHFILTVCLSIQDQA